MSFLAANTQQKSTILVTGGASGIGLAISKRLLDLGHTVIVAGRRQTQLDLAKAENPKLKIIQGDVGTDAGRIALFNKATKDYPELNVLINNAGVLADSSLPPLKDATAANWAAFQSELNINVSGPIHLSILFLPHLLTKENALIANVSSLLAFFPFAAFPVYSATKGEQSFISSYLDADIL